MQILWDINPQEGQNKWSIIESVTEPTNKNKEGFFCYLHPIECTQVCIVYLMYEKQISLNNLNKRHSKIKSQVTSSLKVR